METFSALLALGAGNSPVTGEFPTQRPVTRSFDVFFLICVWINSWINTREAGDLRRYRAHYDVIVMPCDYDEVCWNWLADVNYKRSNGKSLIRNRATVIKYWHRLIIIWILFYYKQKSYITDFIEYVFHIFQLDFILCLMTHVCSPYSKDDVFISNGGQHMVSNVCVNMSSGDGSSLNRSYCLNQCRLIVSWTPRNKLVFFLSKTQQLSARKYV